MTANSGVRVLRASNGEDADSALCDSHWRQELFYVAAERLPMLQAIYPDADC